MTERTIFVQNQPVRAVECPTCGTAIYPANSYPRHRALHEQSPLNYKPSNWGYSGSTRSNAMRRQVGRRRKSSKWDY